MIEAILIERDYKGEYERYALTPEEFNKEFATCLVEDMPPPKANGDSYTLRPLVHMWYKPCEVGSEEWTRFFTDMSWGLPDSDIESGNLAYIREEFMQSLKDYLPQNQTSLTAQAMTVLEEVLNKSNGDELFFAANVLYTLQQDDTPLNREELLVMAQRILDASYCSAAPLLTAERVDAVCTLLTNGMTSNRSPEFPEATPEQMKEVLFNCDMDVFTEIVEAVAVDNQEFYAPDNNYSQDAIETYQKAVTAIQAVTSKKLSLSEQIASAEAKSAKESNSFVLESEHVHR